MDPIRETIIQARVNLLMHLSFFGNLATRLTIEEVPPDSPWALPTAATNGHTIFYNREFFQKLTPKNVEFVFCHEILHNVYEHMSRRGDRDPKLFNIACDYSINGQLIKEHIGEKPDPKTSGINIFYNPKYEGMSPEEIYDILEKNAIKINIDSLGDLLDEHVDWENSPPKGCERLTKEQLKQIRDEVREAVLNAAQAVGAGNVPADIARMIKDFTEPKMNWKELLQQQIQSTIKNDYTFMRSNRKGWHMNAILPGSNYQDTISVTAAIDMSGSITLEQAKDFLSEIRGIMQQYQDFDITVLCFDTQVYNPQQYNAYNIDEYNDYEPRGGGGTHFMCVWDYLKQNELNPKKLIMFTDMYDGGDFGDPDYCDTIFINHGRPGFIAPHGITVEYDM